jgi:hypothetical protein
LDELSALNESKENYIKSSIVKFEKVMKFFPEEFIAQVNHTSENATSYTLDGIALMLANKKLMKELLLMFDLSRYTCK